MHTPAQLMSGLLDYLVEQAKDIDPAAFTLSRVTEFQKTWSDLATLPWVDLNVDGAGEGDDAWLRVHRLETTRAPALSEPDLGAFLDIGDDPAGPAPALQETALAAARAEVAQVVAEDEADQRDRERRARVGHLLQAYLPHWHNWAAREQPRRQVIALYADLFALKTRLEAQEAVRPLELVWGVGVSSWRIPRADGAGVDFHYPLLTQALDIEIDSDSHAITLGPRPIAARLELDALAACDLPGIGDIERAAPALLLAAGGGLSPFEPASFEPVLKSVAGTVSAHARYEGAAHGAPAPGPDLVVTGSWVIFARPRAIHSLTEDIARLKQRIDDSGDLPAGAASIVTRPDDAVVAHPPIAFRGLSGRPTVRGEPRELYFPLPYNREQETIIQQL